MYQTQMFMGSDAFVPHLYCRLLSRKKKKRKTRANLICESQILTHIGINGAETLRRSWKRAIALVTQLVEAREEIMVRPSLWGRSGGQRSPVAARKCEKACSMLHQQHPLPPINWGTSSFWSRLSPHNLAFTSGLKLAPQGNFWR